MKQTSLLDSFIKKKTNSTSNSQQNQQKVQNLQNPQIQSNNSSFKQNNKNTNSSEKEQNIKNVSANNLMTKFDKFKNVQKTTEKMNVSFSQGKYVPQKMEIQQNIKPNFSQTVNNKSQNQFQQESQYQCKKLKKGNSSLNQDDQQLKSHIKQNVKQTQGKNALKSAKNNAKSAKSNIKSAKSKSRKKKDQDDDFDISDEQNSQSYQFASQQNSFSEPQQEDQFVRKPKRNTAAKKNPVKKAENNVNQNKKVLPNTEQACQETMAFDRSRFQDATPQWAVPGNIKCKDKYGVSCKQQNYDQTTLSVPKEAWKDFSAPMKQYWRIKSQNFDKIIFFKLGKFYQLFYEDALIANQLLSLKWMGLKMHVGFPQKSLQRYTNQLVRHGIKVVVVEQMETPDLMNQRLKQDKKKGITNSQKTLKRQVTQIITKGTIHESQIQKSYMPNYLISVYRYQKYIAYTLLEVGTNLILMGIVQGFQEFKTILYQTRPSELLYDPDNLPRDYVSIMKENIQGMILSKLLNKQNLWHHLMALNQLEQLELKNIIKKPEIIQTILQFDNIQKHLMISTLSGLFQYLHRIFKFEYVLSTARFKFYQKQKALTHMVLDSQALQHLEIFETSAGQIGSLFEKIDRTKTKFGKRLFRRWMTSPLLNPYQINQRLDSVQGLKQYGGQLDRIQSILSKLPDLQKLSNRLYKYSVTNTSAATAVYFQDLHTARLKQFDTFMKSMQDSLIAFKLIESNIGNCKSVRLRRLITLNKKQQTAVQQQVIYFEDEQYQQTQNSTIDGYLPDIISHLHSFKQYVIWRQSKPYPKQGVIPKYDQLVRSQKQIIKRLNAQLQKIKAKFKCPQICFAHIKQRYQVQIPQKKSITIPKQYSFSSKKAGYSRYLVPEIQQIVSQLQTIQKGVKNQMGIFVTFFFEQFKQKQNLWERYINILAEIDCYCGMAQYARQRKTCRPKFVETGYQVVEGVHPALYSVDFVPNDIDFRDPIMILTGPNMGGKSTILRTASLLAVMAQMGCFVPARSYSAAIIDRIFTRIGASDKLQAGKSTFFIEMEETKTILSYATSRSLAIIDQLGRGTATFDGMALAHSVLNYLINKIQCKCMFATHYHSLTQQFASMPGTCLKMMDYEIIKGQIDRIDFLYKLVSGKAQKSFGLNVAQLVGLPSELIDLARQKSDQMHEIIEVKKKKIKMYEFLDQIIHREVEI